MPLKKSGFSLLETLLTLSLVTIALASFVGISYTILNQSNVYDRLNDSYCIKNCLYPFMQTEAFINKNKQHGPQSSYNLYAFCRGGVWAIQLELPNADESATITKGYCLKLTPQAYEASNAYRTLVVSIYSLLGSSFRVHTQSIYQFYVLDYYSNLTIR